MLQKVIDALRKTGSKYRLLLLCDNRKTKDIRQYMQSPRRYDSNICGDDYGSLDSYKFATIETDNKMMVFAKRSGAWVELNVLPPSEVELKITGYCNIQHIVTSGIRGTCGIRQPKNLKFYGVIENHVVVPFQVATAVAVNGYVRYSLAAQKDQIEWLVHEGATYICCGNIEFLRVGDVWIEFVI